jgi:hypothetical protein
MTALELAKELLGYPDFKVQLADTNGSGTIYIHSIDWNDKIVWLGIN